jgi:hypothetical protein
MSKRVPDHEFQGLMKHGGRRDAMEGKRIKKNKLKIFF